MRCVTHRLISIWFMFLVSNNIGVPMRDRNVFNWGELGEVVEPSIGRTSQEHSDWSHDGQNYSNRDYDRWRNGHLPSNAMPTRGQNAFRFDELERVVESSSSRKGAEIKHEFNHLSPGYGYLRQDRLLSGQGYDYSIGTTSRGRSVQSQPSAEAPVHDQILQNSAQSPEDDDPAGSWLIPSGTQQVWENLPEIENIILKGKKPRHDVYRAFANTNERGVWASKVDKHIDFHVVINSNKKRDGPKTITLQNNSPTHSVTYTLYDRKTKLFVWEKHLDPEEMEDVTLRSKTGLVNLYVKAGKPVKSR
ncbi:hypothetical protein PGT21_035817 [Puccinia graminis f. sp. tritici]|uniref:Uncharacterized protein n=1 Tax=Puccinia graminis f. sp. tritici TaxID=56615 RepID=A0A5B0Q0K4_PUCGR|nr:hypothetical protein PGT21_035817 [Puccinia graminis f. sp. tritici]KAA1126291.1 hypothetical protein PGTUg99_024009 [Puccinia graminis f. sp. tritici]